ncbi:hypothetical protein AJ79_04067 [Helicocarpus griseus UAMH5409]|uniref:CCHC-type domain-containing protein n=1 Tax=Helicocarpus griseus UAMH5409 TaxID=1447875 RepID=A0A2B7XW25_9EURO|nr:hypothetical protein AJ79_04067 [Helicocarpus griseus UAMH5409]
MEAEKKKTKCYERILQSIDPTKLVEIQSIIAQQGNKDPEEWEVPGAQPAHFQPGFRNRGQDNPSAQAQDAAAVIKPSGPNGKLSQNDFVNNGRRKWREDWALPLCVKCGTLGHMSPECRGNPLAQWEQAVLKRIVFDEAGRMKKSALWLFLSEQKDLTLIGIFHFDV